ncbi:hypothetical protein Cni_G19042 [Canna indica]|uniref:Uncharacterized protein n=1 Tax=Canna indica TaxID=4628 RepID=A0AAQ3KK67_9LILI|nr:hypothetical protein Cni_G19042 [Canna indica]
MLKGKSRLMMKRLRKARAECRLVLYGKFFDRTPNFDLVHKRSRRPSKNNNEDSRDLKNAFVVLNNPAYEERCNVEGKPRQENSTNSKEADIDMIARGSSKVNLKKNMWVRKDEVNKEVLGKTGKNVGAVSGKDLKMKMKDNMEVEILKGDWGRKEISFKAVEEKKSDVIEGGKSKDSGDLELLAEKILILENNFANEDFLEAGVVKIIR